MGLEEIDKLAYNTVKDHVVQYLQKTYNNGQDAAVSMRNLAVMDLTSHEPHRGIAVATDTTSN
jgi:hypothetical protein